jgi:8-oxo-dGTP pyrophosphatase MutT (NUDIX family)
VGDGPVTVDPAGARVVYANAWMTVTEDAITQADGAPGIYGVVHKTDFALVLPRTTNGFWLVEQFRYPVARREWEFPQGTFPAGTTGTALELARAELAEETGLRAQAWTHLGRLNLAAGMSDQRFDVFLAEDLTSGEPAREATEQDMVQRAFTDAEVDAMIRSGALADSASLAALLLYRMS